MPRCEICDYYLIDCMNLRTFSNFTFFSLTMTGNEESIITEGDDTESVVKTPLLGLVDLPNCKTVFHSQRSLSSERSAAPVQRTPLSSSADQRGILNYRYRNFCGANIRDFRG